MITLQTLTGFLVGKVEEIHDYIQIIFSDGTTLSVFNNYCYNGDSVHSIEGKKVKSIKEFDDKIILGFEDNGYVSIGLRDDDFNGPEAMVLMQRGKSLVVWN